MKRNFYLILFLLGTALNSTGQTEPSGRKMMFNFKVDYNSPIKNGKLIFTNNNYGLSHIHLNAFENIINYELKFALLKKNLRHFFGLILTSTKFNFDTLGVYYNYEYYNNTSGLNTYTINIKSKTNYFGLCYSLQYPIKIKQKHGLYSEISVFFGYAYDPEYYKTHYIYNYGIRTEVFPYKSLLFGINTTLGYTFNISDYIQLSAYSGISYRFISIYYHFGLGLNYKFSLPKKKKE